MKRLHKKMHAKIWSEYQNAWDRKRSFATGACPGIPWPVPSINISDVGYRDLIEKFFPKYSVAASVEVDKTALVKMLKTRTSKLAARYNALDPGASKGCVCEFCGGLSNRGHALEKCKHGYA